MSAEMAPSAAVRMVDGRAIVLRGHDIDTDRIMPARFLRAVSFSGIERHLFEDDRASAIASGNPHPIDVAGAAGASVLIVQRNFGCGSSREHAPQAIVRAGIRAVVGESFAEIFFSNATALGMPCVCLRATDLESVMAAVEAAPAEPVCVDLMAMRVRVGRSAWTCTMPAPAREAFVTGTWDATALLLADFDQVMAAADRLPYVRET